MKRTYQSIQIQAPIEKVWDTIKDFYDFSWAPDVITSCTKVGDKRATEIGARRLLNEAIYETLIDWNSDQYIMIYSIDDGPSPLSPEEVKNYVGTLHLLPITKDNTTFVEWFSVWESESKEAVTYCSNVYGKLLDALAKKLS